MNFIRTFLFGRKFGMLSTLVIWGVLVFVRLNGARLLLAGGFPVVPCLLAKPGGGWHASGNPFTLLKPVPVNYVYWGLGCS